MARGGRVGGRRGGRGTTTRRRGGQAGDNIADEVVGEIP